MASVNGNPVVDSFYSNGIRVRRLLNRVRISVPNCENKNLVMMVTCQNRPEPMIRFDIMRGLNLKPTSHGLLGGSGIVGFALLELVIILFGWDIHLSLDWGWGGGGGGGERGRI